VQPNSCESGACELEFHLANWKGFLRLSLVTCPVAHYPATSEYEKVSFKQLNRKTGHRIKYAKVDADAGEEVANEECRSDLYNWMKRMAPTYHPTPVRRRPQGSGKRARQGARDGQHPSLTVRGDAAKGKR
jgi:Ku70/Ku80 beta-barrel domain